MKNVDIYERQVKYAGRFEEHTAQELFDLGQARGPMQDCYEGTVELTDEDALKVDGKITAINAYPCNKIAVVRWYYIAEEIEE